MYKHLIQDAEIIELCNQIKLCKYFAFDTEFIPQDNYRLFSISICIKPGDAYFILYDKINLMNDVLIDKSIRKYGHELKADYQSLFRAGIKCRGLYFDTIIAYYLIDPNSGLKNQGLKKLTKEKLGIEMKDLKEWFKKGQTFEDYYKLNQQEAIDYACADADMTLRLAALFKPRIDKEFKTLFYDIEMPIVEILAQMELKPKLINREYLIELQKEYTSKVNILREEIINEANKYLFKEPLCQQNLL